PCDGFFGSCLSAYSHSGKNASSFLQPITACHTTPFWPSCKGGVVIFCSRPARVSRVSTEFVFRYSTKATHRQFTAATSAPLAYLKTIKAQSGPVPGMGV